MSERVELPVREEQCETCRFWDQSDWSYGDGTVDDDELRGKCVRHPPVIAVVHKNKDAEDWDVGCWPWTLNDAWCGEWKAKAAPGPDRAVGAGEWADKSIDELGLTNRAKNTLLWDWYGRQSIINTIGKLVACSASDLRERRGLGETCLKEVRDALVARGLKLRGD